MLLRNVKRHMVIISAMKTLKLEGINIHFLILIEHNDIQNKVVFKQS